MIISMFFVSVVSFVTLYIKARDKYSEYTVCLDKKKYPLKNIFPVSLWLLEQFKYKYASKYDKKLLNKISELEGVKYSQYYLQINWANKIALVIAGLLIVLFIGSILEFQKPAQVNSIGVEPGGKIQRPNYGEGDKELNVEAKIQKGQSEITGQFSVPVKELPPITDDEKAISNAAENLKDELIKGNNANLQNVKSELKLPKDDKSFGDKGVSVTWKYNGQKVEQEDLKITRPGYGESKRSDVLTAQFSKGIAANVCKTFEITVLPYEIPVTDNQFILAAQNELNKLFEDKGKVSERDKQKLQLPAKLNDLEGVLISWSSEKQQKDHTAIFFVIFGIAALAAITFAHDNDLNKKVKQRRLEIQLDFPEFLNKLTLLINAGMTISRAWEKIVTDNKRKSALYEELSTALTQIKAGKSEAQAYEDFAKRCKINEATKFVSCILQNLKKGNDQLVQILKLQSIECWEIRKNNAKRIGEEASTKLLLPMMIMFFAILIIVAVPSILSMQGI